MARRKRVLGSGPKPQIPNLGGGAGGPGGMAKKLQELQQQMQQTQEALGDETFEGTAGGGVVKVQITGHQTVTGITIDPEVVDPEDVEMLQDLIVAAVNEAIQKSQETASERMGGLTGGLSIPGLF